MKYTIALRKEKEGGYSAQCLEVPGAISQGETKEKALKNIKEAIEMVLEIIKEESHCLGKSTELLKVDVCA
ncbi:MAG: type II toxin-antitoxin system HicB family antitoxin [Candidatus Aenigmarchaeota archaeon]|nr:type II toxin-antitoxin system HicB family antitoxin [Candidatus Aenigmarchaeota archaeon]